MTTYTFTLIAEGPDLQTDELADALFEAGCDDAWSAVPTASSTLTSTVRPRPLPMLSCPPSPTWKPSTGYT